MFDENKLLAFVRTLYQYEKGGCDTCTEYNGYGCSHPGNCEWNWDYAEDLKEFEIPEEVVSMELKKAIEILDGCIPHPSNKMVDREHLDIALAWSVVKAGLYKDVNVASDEDFSDLIELKRCTDFKLLAKNLKYDTMIYIEKILRAPLELIVPRTEDDYPDFDAEWSVRTNDESYKMTGHELLVLKWVEDFECTDTLIDFMQLFEQESNS